MYSGTGPLSSSVQLRVPLVGSKSESQLLVYACLNKKRQRRVSTKRNAHVLGLANATLTALTRLISGDQATFLSGLLQNEQ